MCFEIMEEYGIDEIEATNIINGYGSKNYVVKYSRIRNQVPLRIRRADEVEETEE